MIQISRDDCGNVSLDDASESDTRDLVNELETMKQLKPHPHVIKLVGCVTETGELFSLAVQYDMYILQSKQGKLNRSIPCYLKFARALCTAPFLVKPVSFFLSFFLSFSLCIYFFSEPLLVLIEYVPFGDLLGYLRKSRGLNDTYFKDPDIKPRTNLTSQQLMKFAWQIADGMSYLSSKSVSFSTKTSEQSVKSYCMQSQMS